MRQGDGSDLLGQGDPRTADIGILYVGPEDSRQEILTAISAQEYQGRKQIAIVLPEQGKAFRQPVEFDALKKMRRELKAQLIFIAPSGPGPAEFARHRRFVVYSSLETFKTALLNERASFNPRSKAPTGDEKRPNLLGRGRARKEREQNTPPRVVADVPVPPVPPTPPMPRIQPAASVQPAMPPTPRIQPQASEQGGQITPPVSPIPPASSVPIDEVDTHTLEFEKPPSERGGGGVLLPGALTASALDDDDELAPPVTPRQPQGGQAGGAARSDASTRTPRAPTPLLLGQQTNTPRPSGSGKLPAASAQGSQTRTSTGKQPAAPGRGGSRPGQGRGTRQLSAQGGPDAPAAPKQPNGKNGDTGKTPAVVPLGVVAAGAAAGAAGAAASGAAAPTNMAATGTPGGPGAGQRQVSGLTPLPVPVSQRRRRSRGRKRLLLFLLLGLLTLAVIGGITVSALGGPGGLATLGRLTATVTITPRSQVVQNNYLISAVTGTPAAGQRQVAARVLTAQSDTRSKTVDATGSIEATRAVGSLVFFNSTGSGLTIAGNGQTVLTSSTGVQVTFNEPVFVPATGNSTATINDAYAVQAGSRGNIPAVSITGSCCVAGITVKNPSAFHGGQDPQPNSVIQQNDIDGAVNSLVGQLKTSTQTNLRGQVKSSERVVDTSFQCSTKSSADHKAGDVVKSVTVQVSVQCTEEVFDYAAAQQMASSLLQTNLPSGLDLTGYKLVGPVITSLVSATQVSGANQVSINMQAAGRWVYQFSSQMQQQIKQKLVGKNKSTALNILSGYVGLASANIAISSGSTMPADVNDITLTIVSVPGLQQGTPAATATTGPANTPVGGNTPGVTPTASFIPGS